MMNNIVSFLPAECPWRDTLHWFTSINSTSDYAKELARAGAVQGTVVIAGTQTDGRGRMGRSFVSNPGGIYLSVILRPHCSPRELMHLTCGVGVALCNAVEAVTGFRPGIKWTNDLVAQGKKLGGILTELSTNPESGLVDYAIVGIGLNCKEQDFPEDVRQIALSLEAAIGKLVDMEKLTGSIISSLWEMSKDILNRDFIHAYRADCITLGQEISLIRGDEIRHGKAIDLDPEGSLWVAFSDGKKELVQSGEVSIRGMYGYV